MHWRVEVLKIQNTFKKLLSFHRYVWKQKKYTIDHRGSF